MISTQITRRPSELPMVILLQLILFISVYLDIPVVRQVVGFVYLTFIPGAMIIRLLNLDHLDKLEYVLYSLGFSVAFLMFIGLLTNELLPLIGISRPLSWVPLLTIIHGIVLIICIASHPRENEFLNIFESSRILFPLLILAILPFLSTSGALLMNTYQNNFLLLLMIIVVSVLVVILTIFQRFKLTQKHYSLALLMISIALLYHSSLISNYVYGADIKREQFLFRVANSNSRWNSSFTEYPIDYEESSSDIMNTMLSITVLPTIFSSILNMDETWILKIVYPLIFSFIPLGLYQLYQKQVSRKAAFLAAFFFMAFGIYFSELLGLARQMIAELFFILLFLVILNPRVRGASKNICYIIFSAGLIVSHYAMSSLFTFIILFTYLSLYMLRRNKPTVITASYIITFLVMMFAWYIYVSKSAAFNEVIITLETVYRSTLTEFFNPQSRGSMVLRGLGLEGASSLLSLISRLFAYLTQFFIVVGFITLLKRRKDNLFTEYNLFILLNMTLLMMSIILPNFARQLNMSRLYHIVLFFLSPLCIIGGQTLFNFIPILRDHERSEFYSLSMMLIILIPYFLFQTEFIYEIAGHDSWSLPLSKYRMGTRTYVGFGVVDEQDVYGAKWLSNNIYVDSTLVYTSKMSLWVLVNYGTSYNYNLYDLSNTTIVLPNSIIYLRRVNTFYGIIIDRSGIVWNITDIAPILISMNKIYSNGGSEIHR